MDVPGGESVLTVAVNSANIVGIDSMSVLVVVWISAENLSRGSCQMQG